MRLHLIAVGAITAVFSTSVCSAAVSWLGTTDNDLFTDTNWDFSGADNGATSFPASMLINENVIISNATVTGTGVFALNDGFSLTLDNVTFTLGNGSGFGSEVIDGPNVNRENPPMTVNATNGSIISIQFATKGIGLNIDGTSALTIRGGGDGINSQDEDTVVNLATGATITMVNVAELDEQIGEGDIFVNGVVVTAANKSSLLSGSGATVTAVPEPSAIALLGLGGLAFIVRRKK